MKDKDRGNEQHFQNFLSTQMHNYIGQLQEGDDIGWKVRD